MKNKEKYQNIFLKSLALNENKFSENIKYNEVPEWDSIGHMTLIAALEEEFSISGEILMPSCRIKTSTLEPVGKFLFEKGKK